MNVVFEGKKVHFRSNRKASGDARPVVVYLHGAGGTGTHWLGVYRATQDDLANIVLDLPGHGGSEGPAPDSVAAYAEWFARILGALSLDPAEIILAGHSMGGAIAMEYALAGHPLAGLVLVGTGARMRVSPLIFEALKSGPEAWSDTGASFFYAASLSPAQRLLAQQEMAKTPTEIYRQDFEACNRWDAMDRVKNVTVPTLVVCGAGDQASPLKYSQYLSEQISGAKMVVLPDAGHMPMIEATAPLSQALKTFVHSLPVQDRFTSPSRRHA